MKQSKSLILFLISLLYIAGVVYSTSLEVQKKQIDLTIPDGAKIFFQGWTKYYYANKNILKPQDFFQNNMYYSQRYPTSISKKTDKFGSFVIPDESSFFAVVYLDQIAIYSSRDEIMRNNVDTLLIENVLPVPEDDYLAGSMKNLGKFKAGFCVKIGVKTPTEYKNTDNLQFSTWIFCFQENNTKSQFLKAVAKMKIIDQRSRDQIVTAGTGTADTDDPSSSGSSTPAANQDGKLVMLQDWSDCTLKCGGGKSYQQWMCIPPTKGGLPCKGDLIQSKDCNTDPCPEATSNDDPNNQPATPFVKPIVKIARFSQRFARYTKCIIKETDIFKIDEGGNKIPARLLMNNKTFTIYGDDTYENKEYSFDLQETTFALDDKFCCFNLTDTKRSKKFCGFDAICGDPDANLFAKGMQNDFNEFKTICNVGRQTTVITDEDKKAIKDKSAKAKQAQTFEVESKKMDTAQAQMETDTDNKVFTKIQATQNTGLKALQKEIMIEGLIKQDEEKKQNGQTDNVSNQIAAEKAKSNQVNQILQEKAIEAAFQADIKSAEKDIKAVKQEINVQIEVNRDALKAQIQKIRQMAKSRRTNMQTKLKQIKSKIAQKIMAASSNGDKTLCTGGLTDQNASYSYCDGKHPDDYLENQYCKDVDNYCYSCCDSEFGLLLPAERDDCYNTCDKARDDIETAKQAAIDAATKKSQWQWKASAKVPTSTES